MHWKKINSLRPVLLAAAMVGLVGINGPFLYFTLLDRETCLAALGNGMALVFLAEALFLMFLFAVLIAKMGWKKPGWLFFIAMSLLGSLAFSIPFQLYLLSRPGRAGKDD